MPLRKGRINVARLARAAGLSEKLVHARLGYGATLKEALTVAGKACNACGDDNQRTLVWDHDHKTGKFRGFLCNRCNLALGLMKDNPSKIRALADYIENGNFPLDGGKVSA